MTSLRSYFNLLAVLLKDVANAIFKLLAPLWNSKIPSCYLKSRDEVWIFRSQNNKNSSYENKELINKKPTLDWFECPTLASKGSYLVWLILVNIVPLLIWCSLKYPEWSGAASPHPSPRVLVSVVWCSGSLPISHRLGTQRLGSRTVGWSTGSTGKAY